MWLVGASAVGGNLPFRITDGEFVVGRTQRVQIVLDHATVSRRHARLIGERGSLLLEDLGSANGTVLNGSLVTRSELTLGDRVCFGLVECVVLPSPLASTVREESTYPAHRRGLHQRQADKLTPAQRIIAEYVLEGHDEQQIALLLHKSPHTIHTHLKAIFQRLQVHSRAELVATLARAAGGTGGLP
jgi:DNA-binding CsgD family transcriptional regulator